MEIERPKLSSEVTEAVEQFFRSSGFTERGGVITDLDGTAVHEDKGRIYIPEPVEYGLRAIYEQGRPVVLNSLRFPLSVMRTFGKEWLAIAQAPIPVISMNGSQTGFVTTDEKGELCFEEIAAFPLSANEIDSVLAGVDALLEDDIRDVLLFYYPRDWRLGEIIWTPVAEKVLHVKEKYTSASSVIAVETEKLAEMLHSEQICMIFLLIERPADDLMAYQHSKPSSFFTAKGVDKFSGTLALAEPMQRHRGEIVQMFVSPAAQGRGIGEMLLRSVVEAAFGLPGIESTELSAVADNEAARNLYERVGFTLTV